MRRAFRLLVASALLGPCFSPEGHLLIGHEARAASAPGAAESPDFAALSEADRKALQDALVWTGDFNGVASGLFGPKTREALAAYAKRMGLQPADLLDPAQRARLLAIADGQRKAVGFAPVLDGRTGMRLSLPLKLLSQQSGSASSTRYGSADGSASVDLVAKPADAGALAEAFARISAPGTARRIDYTFSRPTYFVVSGETGDRKFYTRFDSGVAGGVPSMHGFTFTYRKNAARALDRVAIAIAGSFVPFPGATAGERGGAVAERSAPATAAPGSPPTNSPAPTMLGDAVLVGPGLALGHFPAAGCATPEVGNRRASWRSTAGGGGLALLDVPGAEGPAVQIAATVPAEGTVLYALFHPGRGPSFAGSQAVAAAAADVLGAGDDGPEPKAVLASVADGAVLFDAAGRLAGIAAERERPPAAVAGVVPRTRYDLLGPDRIGSFLGTAGVTLGNGPDAASETLGAVAARFGPAVLPVLCSPPSADPR